MKNQNTLFLVLGILAILAGIYQLTQQRIFLGISALIIGIGLGLKGYSGMKNNWTEIWINIHSMKNLGNRKTQKLKKPIP